jgi:hypothetical protein
MAGIGVRVAVSGAVAVGLLTGCSHYYLPANRLESPEARGEGSLGRFEVAGAQSGVDLVSNPQLVTPQADPQTGAQDPSYLQMQNAIGNFLVGFNRALSDRIDLGVRFSPYAPVEARFKYQLTGLPETKADRGNFSMAALAGAGFTLGSGGTGGSSVTFFSGEAALLAGYRVWSRHLFSLGPFFSFGSLSGTGPSGVSNGGGGSGSGSGSSSLPSGITAPAATGNSASEYGGALGYQYTIEQLFLRAEVAYVLGSVGSAKISGIDPAVLIGLAL